MKANIFQKFKKWWTNRKVNKTALQAEADYIRALSQVSDLRREWHVRRLIAYLCLEKHLHADPVSRKVSINDPPFA